DEPHAVGIGLLEALALLVERAESVEVTLEAFLQFDLADDRHLREVSIARNVVAMRLGVDQIADRCLLLHPLAPAHRVDRLVRRIDHDIAVAGLDKARIAAGEIDFGERVRSDPAHRRLRCPRSPAIFPDQPKRYKGRPATVAKSVCMCEELFPRKAR